MQSDAKSVTDARHPIWREWLGDRIERFAAGNSFPLFFSWCLCAVILFLALIVFASSFIVDFPINSRLSLGNYHLVLDKYLFAEVLPNTLIVGLGTVAISLFFSVPLAWLLNRTNVPLGSTFMTLMAVVIIVPGFLKGIGWLLLLSPNIGLINKFFMGLFNLKEAPFNISTLGGISFIQGLMLAPVIVFLLAHPLRALDKSLEEASEVAGISRWKTILWIDAPLIWPAILGGAIYVFMIAISVFEIPALLGGLGGKNPVLATELFLNIYTYSESVPKYGVSGVYGVLVTVPTMALFYLYYRSIRQSYRYVTVTGKGYKPRIYDLGLFKYVGMLFVLFYLSLAAFFPFLVLLWVSVIPYLQMPSAEAWSVVSFHWYRLLMERSDIQQVIWNTLILILSVSAVVVFFSFMISWIVTRTKLRIRGLLDGIAMLPQALPHLGFGLALLVLGLMARKWLPWFSFHGTIGIIAVAYVVTRISYATRITNAALLQVSQELEEAAFICGAKKFIIWWKVIVPIIGQAVVFAGLWTALLSFREVTVALILTSLHNRVLAVQVWTMWLTGDVGQAAALGVLMILAMSVIFLLTLRLTSRRLGTHGIF